ncbi:hypothetical protein [Castellaniella sp.]
MNFLVLRSNIAAARACRILLAGLLTLGSGALSAQTSVNDYGTSARSRT